MRERVLAPRTTVRCQTVRHMPKVERHPDRVVLSNGEVELIAPLGYGPRVMRYARIGGPNAFGELSPAKQRMATPFGDDWHIHGGHRLWYAPEGDPRSYYPDNSPVRLDVDGTRITLSQAVEPHSHLEKAITLELADDGSRVVVTHALTNHGMFAVELAPWALSVMSASGRAIFPVPPFVPHPTALAPARPLVVWPFTRMNDPRFGWGDRLLFLRHDPAAPAPQKIGMYDPEGWMAYHQGDQLFVTRHDPRPGPHADFGCNVETFTNDEILELETLGPLVSLAPGQTVKHEERWYLFAGVELGEDEVSVAQVLAPLIASTR